MAVYQTCINCIFSSGQCAKREEVRLAIKGIGITTVKFRCPIRKPIFSIGQRVLVSWPVYQDGDQYICEESWPATIISESGTRFLINIDDVDSDNGTPARSYIKNERLFARVSASRISKLDEPVRRICSFCGLAPDAIGKCSEIDLDCWRGSNGFPPSCVFSNADGTNGQHVAIV